jgi:hypothetical protein
MSYELMSSAANVAHIHLLKQETGKRKLHGIKLLQLAYCQTTTIRWQQNPQV